ALTILRGFFLEIKPHDRPQTITDEMQAEPYNLRPASGLNPQWNRVIRFAVRWCGMEDPALTMDDLREAASDEIDSRCQLVAAFDRYLSEETVYKRTAAELAKDLAINREKYDQIREAFAACLPRMRGETPDAREIGTLFRNLAGRFYDGRAIVAEAQADKAKRSKRWMLERLDERV
ncbi:MAG: hypothetical protein AAF657_34535, partial [Acidobacteriota bacterium]